jgi:hypothetical protein
MNSRSMTAISISIASFRRRSMRSRAGMSSNWRKLFFVKWRPALWMLWNAERSRVESNRRRWDHHIGWPNRLKRHLCLHDRGAKWRIRLWLELEDKRVVYRFGARRWFGLHNSEFPSSLSSINMKYDLANIWKYLCPTLTRKMHSPADNIFTRIMQTYRKAGVKSRDWKAGKLDRWPTRDWKCDRVLNCDRKAFPDCPVFQCKRFSGREVVRNGMSQARTFARPIVIVTDDRGLWKASLREIPFSCQNPHHRLGALFRILTCCWHRWNEKRKSACVRVIGNVEVILKLKQNSVILCQIWTNILSSSPPNRTIVRRRFHHFTILAVHMRTGARYAVFSRTWREVQTLSLRQRCSEFTWYSEVLMLSDSLSRSSFYSSHFCAWAYRDLGKSFWISRLAFPEIAFGWSHFSYRPLPTWDLFVVITSGGNRMCIFTESIVICPTSSECRSCSTKFSSRSVRPSFWKKWHSNMMITSFMDREWYIDKRWSIQTWFAWYKILYGIIKMKTNTLSGYFWYSVGPISENIWIDHPIPVTGEIP